MRHRRKITKLGRSPSHRKALISSQVCSLIREKRIKTTLSKAKLCRSAAEQAVTVAKTGTLSARRKLIAELRHEEFVTLLFDQIVPAQQNRTSGYTRIVKLGRRPSDGSEMAILEWCGNEPVSVTPTTKLAS